MTAARRPAAHRDDYGGAEKVEDECRVRLRTADDCDAALLLVDLGASSGLSRGAAGPRRPSPRSRAVVVLSIASRRAAAPPRRERIERGVADLDAAHARAEAADVAELLAGAPEGRA